MLTSVICVYRYQHTVRVCALQEDLSSLPYGDLTEVSRARSSAALWQHGSLAAQAERAEAGRPWFHPHLDALEDRKVPGSVGKAKFYHPEFSIWAYSWGNITMDVVPTLPVLGSVWSLLEPFPISLLTYRRFLVKVASVSCGQGLSSKDRGPAVLHCGWSPKGLLLISFTLSSKHCSRLLVQKAAWVQG